MQELPKLRVLALSATAATELQNMGYMDRLGLWGPGTAFPGGFTDFAAQVGTKGLSALEMVARELKSAGRYMSRTLAFRGENNEVVTYETAEAPLNPQQKEIFRTAAQAWRKVLDTSQEAIEAANGGNQAKAAFGNAFWGDQQRFFNLLITAMKIPQCITVARKALSDGNAVVISLINTNEASQKRAQAQKALAEAAGEEVDDLDFGPREILVKMIRERFPVQQWQETVDEQGKAARIPLRDEDGNPVVSPEAVRMRDDLIAEIERDLHLPGNPLDLLIEALGGTDQVAEITGRTERVDPSTGKFLKRSERGIPQERINVVEAQRFQDGKKLVAILSNAGGTGISLQADRTAKNQRKRVHITLQVGWDAAKVIQMLGRTHRANQAHPPAYVFIQSDLAGEKRFLSTISARLGSLGALSKGERASAGGTREMQELNFDSAQGRAATVGFYNALERNQVPSGVRLTGPDILKQMGMVHYDQKFDRWVMREMDKQKTNRLLNRIMMLDPDVQNAVYEQFFDIFQQVVESARARGELDSGAQEVTGDTVKIAEDRLLYTDPESQAETRYYRVQAEVPVRRVTADQAEARLRDHQDDDAHYRTQDATGKIGLFWKAPPIVHANGQIEPSLYRLTPSGKRTKVAEARLYSWKPISTANAPKRWATEYEATPTHTTIDTHLIGGAVLKWWNTVQSASQGFIKVATARDTATGQRVVGVEVSPRLLTGALSTIQGGAVKVTADQLYRDVLDNATPYTLAGGTRITRGTLGRQREPVLQFHPSNERAARRLTTLGVLYERGVIGQHYLPSKRETAYPLLRTILDEFPAEVAAPGERGSATPEANPVVFGATLIRDGIVRFSDWSKRMIERFGESIRRNLVQLYYQARAAAHNLYVEVIEPFAREERGEMDLDVLFKTPLAAITRTKDPLAALGRSIRGTIVADAAELLGSSLGARVAAGPRMSASAMPAAGSSAWQIPAFRS
jgi:hypothetical protein